MAFGKTWGTSSINKGHSKVRVQGSPIREDKVDFAYCSYLVTKSLLRTEDKVE